MAHTSGGRVRRWTWQLSEYGLLHAVKKTAAYCAKKLGVSDGGYALGGSYECKKVGDMF